MSLDKISETVRFGLSYERMRVEVASYNLAISNLALKSGTPSTVQRVAVPSGFFQHMQGKPIVITESVEERLQVDHSHPLADEKGLVHYPKVDAAKEMATLVSATRAYEANIRAYNSLRAMTLKAFEIGKQT